MKIEIETKYDVGDIVIGYKPQYGFVKYIIKDVIIERRSYDYTGGIEYLCEMLTNSECTCRDSFTENELFTESDIYERLNKFMTYPTTTEQARHDINMYLGLKNILWNTYTHSEIHPSDLIKWLESKFPEIEQYVKTNMK